MGNSSSYCSSKTTQWKNMCSCCPTIKVEWNDVHTCCSSSDGTRQREPETFEIVDTPYKTRPVGEPKTPEASSPAKSHTTETLLIEVESNVPGRSQPSETSLEIVIHEEPKPSEIPKSPMFPRSSRSSKEAGYVQDVDSIEEEDLHKSAEEDKVQKSPKSSQIIEVSRSSECGSPESRRSTPTPRSSRFLDVPIVTFPFKSPDETDTSTKRRRTRRRQRIAPPSPEEGKIDICINDAGEAQISSCCLSAITTKRLKICLPSIILTDDRNIDHVLFNPKDDAYEDYGLYRKGLCNFKSLFSISSKPRSPQIQKKDIETIKKEWMKMKESLDMDVYALSLRSERSRKPKRTRSAMNLLFFRK